MLEQSLVVLLLAVGQARAPHEDVGSSQVGRVSLRLECDEATARLSIANTGTVDTTLGRTSATAASTCSKG
jgi:hypothetical protein